MQASPGGEIDFGAAGGLDLNSVMCIFMADGGLRLRVHALFPPWKVAFCG
jgi:hypothetical protein